MKYEWFIGLRYLKAKRKQTFISIITVISIAGVMVGVMALIVVLAVMSGFEKTLKEKILGTQAHLHLLKATQEGLDQYQEITKKVEETKGVASAAPFIISQVMLSSESNVFGVVLKGIDPDRVGRVTELGNNLKSGRLEDLKVGKEADPPGIILGNELAKHLSVSLNYSIQVISDPGPLRDDVMEVEGSPMLFPKLSSFAPTNGAEIAPTGSRRLFGSPVHLLVSRRNRSISFLWMSL